MTGIPEDPDPAMPGFPEGWRRRLHDRLRAVDTKLMTLEEMTTQQNSMLSIIHNALVGDSLGNAGLVSRVVIIETNLKAKADEEKLVQLAKAVELHDRKIWFGGVLATVVWAAIVAFRDKLFGK